MRNALVFLLLLVTSLFAVNQSSSLVTIEGVNQTYLQEMQRMDLDMFGYSPQDGSLQAIITREQQQRLQVMGLRIIPVIRNLSQHLDRLHNSYYFSHFHSVQQIEAYMFDLEWQYPDIIRVEDIGDSYLKTVNKGGHDILALKLSDDVQNEDPTEADIFYGASIHAREIITSEVLIVFLDSLLAGYGSDPRITHLVNNREMWFVPCINPDGREYVFTGDYDAAQTGGQDPVLWRKNLKDNNNDGQFNYDDDGVDLNRNFGYTWGYDDLGSSPDPFSFGYRGTAPFSEPETQAFRNLVQRQDFVISLMYHSFRNLWLYPWVYAPILMEGYEIFSFQALADSCVAYNGYKRGNNASKTIYQVNGGSDDWMFGEHGIFAFTPEVGTVRSGAFWPNLTAIDSLTSENLGPNIFMAYAAGQEPIVQSVTDSPDTVLAEPLPGYPVSAAVTPAIPLKNPASLDVNATRVYYRYGRKGEFNAITMSFDAARQQYSAEIPGDDFRGTIQYYISASDTLGRTGCWPRTAPLELDSIKIRVMYAGNAELIDNYFVLQNYPNPFNENTFITFILWKGGPVSLVVYNRLGQEVRAFATHSMTSGPQRVEWDGRDNAGRKVSSGVYFCRIESEGRESTAKMLYMR